MVDYTDRKWTKGQTDWHLPYNNLIDDIEADINLTQTDLKAAELEIQNARGTELTLAARLDRTLNADGTITASDNIPVDWKESGHTPTYMSASSFSVTGDQTSIYVKNRRLKITLSTGAVYGTIANSTFGSFTHVTIKQSNITNTISAVAYGIVSSGDTGSMPDIGGIDENTSLVFRTMDIIQENHGGAISMEAGWSDSFGTQNEQGADEANSTGEYYSSGNKLYQGTPGGTQNSDKDYQIESNYLQQTWNAQIIGGNATFTNGSATVTTTGTWPTGIDGGRISQDGTNFYNILSKDSGTQITIDSNFAQTTATSEFTLYLTKFDSGVVKLNSASGSVGSDVTDIDTGAKSNFGTQGYFGASYNTEWYSQQSFTPTQTGILKGFSWIYRRYGNDHPSAVWIFTENGNDLAVSGGKLAESDTIHTSALTHDDYNEWTFSGSNQITLTAGTKYCARLVLLSGHSGTYTQSLHRAMYDKTNNYYTGGRASHSNAKDNLNSTGDYNLTSQYPTTSDFGFKLKLAPSTTASPTLYASVVDTYPQSVDVSSWSNISSATVSEVLDSENAYYWLLFNAASGFGANSEVKIFNQTGSVWRKIVKNNAGTFQYNNSSAHDAAESWVDSTTNDLLFACSQAVSSQAANRMTGTEAAAISDAEWEATNGFATSDTLITRGLTLKTASSSIPEVSQFRINYDSETASMDLRSKSYDPNFVPVEAYLWARVEHSTTDGAGTFYVSRNGGRDWSVITMTQMGLPITGNQRIFRGTIDLTSQPSAQDLRCRYVTAQGKDQYIHSWGLQART